MQIHLFKQNSINTSRGTVSIVSVFLSVIVVSITVAVMIMFSGYITLVGGILLIGAVIRYLAINLNKKPLLLEITGNDIIYLPENQKEPVTICSEDITAIRHKFCELQISTKDDKVHLINLMNTNSEQTRWEIKELVKSLVAKIGTVN